MVTFWASVKNIIFKVELLWKFLGYFWKNLGYILYQHLVTLPTKVGNSTVLTRPVLKLRYGKFIPYQNVWTE